MNIQEWFKRTFPKRRPTPYVANWARPWDGSRDVAGLMAAVSRGAGTWAASEHGECCTCGHGWRPGEIIGAVTQAYERTGDGGVKRSPGVRLACAMCVEGQRVGGDPSIAWAREAGLL